MESIKEKGRIEEEEWVGDDEKVQGECRLYWVSYSPWSVGSDMELGHWVNWVSGSLGHKM